MYTKNVYYHIATNTMCTSDEGCLTSEMCTYNTYVYSIFLIFFHYLQDTVHIEEEQKYSNNAATRSIEPDSSFPAAKKQRISESELFPISSDPLFIKAEPIETEPQITITPEMPTICKVWGEKLLELDPQQRLLAEKAINDILFEASQGLLNRQSVKINEGTSKNSAYEFVAI